MNYVLIADLSELIGGLVIAYAVLAVHHRMMHEHRIEGKVIKLMKLEQVIGVVGVGFLIAGFLIRHIIAAS